MASKDTNIGAKRARQAREQLGLDPAASIDCLLTLVEETLELPVVVARLPEAIAGCCWRDGDDVVIWVNGTQAAVRQRFTLAHELGHVRCDHDLQVAVDTFETLSGRVSDSREVQANAFAAELLAPAAGVRAMVDGEVDLEAVVRVAARHGISTIAALFRMNTLGLVDRYEELRQSVEDGEAGDVWERLRPPELDDLIAAIGADDLPRLSPSLRDSALAAILGGSASAGGAAGAAHVGPRRLVEALQTMAG